MYYVYLIRSLQDPARTYIGSTNDIEQRLDKHNSGATPHTRPFKPWQLVASIAVDTKAKALALEKYLKIGSGHTFAQRRLW